MRFEINSIAAIHDLDARMAAPLIGLARPSTWRFQSLGTYAQLEWLAGIEVSGLDPVI